MAQEQVVVSFAKGTSSQTLKGSIKGDQEPQLLRRRPRRPDDDGRRSPRRRPPPTSTSIAPGADTAMFIGSSRRQPLFHGPSHDRAAATPSRSI
ncbi:MAG: hypothetical protein MZV49_13025 [Rhodopseudomonas palustris]|nr:hypothetical protein [Rhodopseudomonas palustris]